MRSGDAGLADRVTAAVGIRRWSDLLLEEAEVGRAAVRVRRRSLAEAIAVAAELQPTEAAGHVQRARRELLRVAGIVTVGGVDRARRAWLAVIEERFRNAGREDGAGDPLRVVAAASRGRRACRPAADADDLQEVRRPALGHRHPDADGEGRDRARSRRSRAPFRPPTRRPDCRSRRRSPSRRRSTRCAALIADLTFASVPSFVLSAIQTATMRAAASAAKSAAFCAERRWTRA